MSQIELPEGWCEATLQDVADWGSGGTPSRKYAEYYDGDIPWVKTGDLGPKLLESCSESITELGVKNSSAKLFSKGSVALAMYGATIGRTSILGMDATTNQACAVGNPVKGLTSSEFLYYFLSNEKDRFIAKGKGGAQPNISQAVIKEHPFFLPPLAEQQIIADKLDNLLSQVESIKARLERIPEIIKQFRQSVLAAAVSGKLTEEWRGNNGVSIDDWKKHKIGSLVSVVNGKAFPSSDYTDSGVKLLRPGNLNVSGSVIWNTKNTTYIPSFWIDKRPELIIEKWALLMNLTAQSLKDDFLGRVCIYESEERVMLNQRICSFVSKIENDITPYLYYFFKSPEFREYVDTLDTGTLIKHLNVKDVLKFEVKVPTDEEQTEIIKQIKQRLEQIEYIEDIVCNALERINNLTQSILAKAFRGELTAEWREANPDLISGENSAEALLKRINAQRESAKSATKRGRGKA